MPAFHPDYNGQLHLPNPVATNHGEGYKAAIYEDFPPYGAPHSGYSSAGSHAPGLAYHGQAERYPPPVHSDMYVEPASAFPGDDWYPDHPCLHPLPAPMMAPIHVGERYVPAHNNFQPPTGYAPVPEPTYPKEEKPTGGVSAKLDYDMDQMTEFVSESTVAIIKPGHSVQPAFRKWVLQVLNATRLPSTTIMLSLSYLAIRIRQLSTDRGFRIDERTYYKMITIGLILGSKFLDDNTFQNKSWAEVSNIPVRELNQDEREWLVAFGHRLHHDPHRVDGFEAAQDQWKAFQNKVNVRLPALQPLDTNLRRHRSMQALSTFCTQPQNKSNTRNFALDPTVMDRTYPAASYSQYGNWHDSGYQSSMDQSPLSSASHSGPQTPEYINGSGYGWGPFNHYAPRGLPSIGPYTAQTAFPSDYQLPPFQRPRYAAWNCHGAHCQCQMCRHQSHTMLPRFHQAVMA